MARSLPLLAMVMMGLLVGSVCLVSSYRIRAGLSFFVEWASNVSVSNVVSISLLGGNDGYYIVLCNGTHIVVANSTGYVVRLRNIRDMLNSSSVDGFGVGYLSSNISHVFATVVYVVETLNPNFGDAYDIYVGLVMVDEYFERMLLREKVATIIGDMSSFLVVHDVRLRQVGLDIDYMMTPTLRCRIGNISSNLYSAVYIADGINLVLISEVGQVFHINTYSQLLGYSVGHVLSTVYGNQLVLAMKNVSGSDYVYVIVLYEDADGNIEEDVYREAIGLNIAYAGSVPDVACYDIDGDGIDEIIIDNGTSIIILEETNDTQYTNMLYTKMVMDVGAVDKLVIGNYTGDDAPEFIFYDPYDKRLEIWNLTNMVFSLNINGSPLRDIVLCDINRDGYVDVFLMTNTTAYFIYNNTYDVLSLLATPTSNGLLADIDMDGYLEFIYAANSTLYCYQTYYTGIGNIQFLDTEASKTFNINGDIDRDGLNNWEELYIYGTSPYIPNTGNNDAATYNMASSTIIGEDNTYKNGEKYVSTYQTEKTSKIYRIKNTSLCPLIIALFAIILIITATSIRHKLLVMTHF